MTPPPCLLPGNSEPACARRPPLGARLRAFGTYLGVWLETSVAYYRAAAMYEQLSKLSEDELRRRGLSRKALGWDVAQACDRTRD
jgi:hypothetical protein